MLSISYEDFANHNNKIKKYFDRDNLAQIISVNKKFNEITLKNAHSMGTVCIEQLIDSIWHNNIAVSNPSTLKGWKGWNASAEPISKEILLRCCAVKEYEDSIKLYSKNNTLTKNNIRKFFDKFKDFQIWNSYSEEPYVSKVDKNGERCDDVDFSKVDWDKIIADVKKFNQTSPYNLHVYLDYICLALYLTPQGLKLDCLFIQENALEHLEEDMEFNIDLNKLKKYNKNTLDKEITEYLNS